MIDLKKRLPDIRGRNSSAKGAVRTEVRGTKISQPLKERLRVRLGSAASRSRKARQEFEEVLALCESEVDRQILEQREAWRKSGQEGDGTYKCLVVPGLTPDAIQHLVELYSAVNWVPRFRSESGKGDYLVLRPRYLETSLRQGAKLPW